MNAFQRLMAKARAKSPWFYCVNAGSCNGCDIELAAALSPRYDVRKWARCARPAPSTPTF